MERSNESRLYVRRRMKAAIGVMLIGAGAAMGSALVAAAGFFMMPLRAIRWRPTRKAMAAPTRSSLPDDGVAFR